MLPQLFDVEMHMHGLDVNRVNPEAGLKVRTPSLKRFPGGKRVLMIFQLANDNCSSTINMKGISSLNKVFPQPFDIEMQMHGLGSEQSKS